jgi:hypothetical protein
LIFIPALHVALYAPFDEEKLTDTPKLTDPKLLADIALELPEVLTSFPIVIVVEDPCPFQLV